MDNNYYSENEVIQGQDLRTVGIRTPGIGKVSIVYSISMILLFVLGSRAQHREFYSGILITEFGLMLVPSLAMLLIYRYDIRQVLRLNRVSLMNLFMIFWIMVFAIPVVAILNLANYWLIKYIFGKVAILQPPTATDAVGLLVSVLVIGGSAGICEELLFRGVILRGFERFGAAKGILITAFLFGLMHVDFQKLLGTFLLGALIGFMVYRTNSLLSGMFAHFANNSLSVLVVYASSKLTSVLKSPGMEDLKNKTAGDLDFSAITSLPTAQLAAVIIFWVFFGVACIAAFAGVLSAFIKNTQTRRSAHSVIPETVARSNRSILVGLMGLIPGVLLVGFRYFAQGLAFKGISIQWVDNVLKVLGMG